MYTVHIYIIYTALHNHNRSVFEEITFWTALLWYIGMKTGFWTKHLKNKNVWIFIMMIFNFHNIIRECVLTLE